jgi:hypothetical protein
MTVLTAKSTRTDAAVAARELADALAPGQPRLVLYFASAAHDPARLASELQAAVGDAVCIGCTTAGEMITGAMLKKGVVAMGLGADVVGAVHVAVVDDVRDPGSVRSAVERLARAVDSTPADLDPSRYVGLVLHDGLTLSEEGVMDALGTVTNVPFVGGSAGDDLAFQRTFVIAGAEPMSGKAILTLLETRHPYAILKTQSFDVTDAELEVTAADEANRTVYEFDGRPAVQAYAAAVGVAPADLPGQFQQHPLGLVTASGEPFVRSPQQVKGDSVVFYCQMKKGTKLRVLRARDIVDDTRRDLQAKLAELGGSSGIMNFHCILRTLELEEKGETQAYADVFTGTPMIGFSTYGESYIGHVNQTSTMLILGK